MPAIPSSVVKYVRTLWMSEMVITYLVVDLDGNLQEWGGHPRYYGLTNLIAGQPVTEQIFFLEGLLPASHTEILQFVNMGGSTAHVHILPCHHGTWILLLDATVEHERQQQIQQQVNELSLLNYRQTQLLNQIEEARQGLVEEKQHLEEIIAVKSRLIASLSHELRTPLSSIIGYTDLLDKAKQEDEKATDYLTTVKNNAAYLLGLIDNILDQAKLEAGKIELKSGHCDVKQLVNDLKALFFPAAQDKNLVLEFVLQSNIPSKILVDSLRLRQVLINLVSNGIKFTQAGQVKLEVTWENDKLIFLVQDTGSGISPEAKEKIFDPFHREENTTHIQGTGLGLTISYQLVKLMGGELKVVESSPNGSTFSGFVVAPEVYQHESIPLPQSDTTTDQYSSPVNAKVLVVDDNSVIRMLTEIYLKGDGYTVITASSGEEGIDVALKEQPDVILMDLLMPDIDGYIAVKRLREQHFSHPIIALSASNFDSDYDYALAAGCNGYLTKPVDVTKLLDKVRSMLKN